MSDLSAVNPLAFQYQLRAAMLEGLDGDQRHIASEQRDRELEDYLGSLDHRVSSTVYVNADGPVTGPVCFKATAPVADDFGTDTIPDGAVWVQSLVFAWDGTAFV